MPMRRKAYPRDWHAVSLAARERAGWKCEECGVPHRAVIVRVRGTSTWVLADDLDDMNASHAASLGFVGDEPVTQVILTVHHKGIDKPDGTPGDRHDKMDCRPENLAALCQRCHLLADLDLHMANAAETRRRKKIAAGQAEMELRA